MNTYECQKIVTTSKTALNVKKRPFATIDIEAITTAMVLLKASTFKIWVYFAKNVNNYTFALSCVDVCRFCKISARNYYSAIQELTELGYLVHNEDNHYTFYESLPEKEEMIVTVKKGENIEENSEE